MKNAWQSVVVATALVAWCVPAAADQGRGHGKGKAHRADTSTADRERASTVTASKHDRRVRDDRAIAIDRDAYRRVISDYYSRESLPPGLAKRQSLPPGLQKQLRERGHLPPGLQKRLTPFPGPLVSRLPGSPYRRYFAGRDVIVVDPRTNMVVAVIPDALAVRR